MGTLQLILEILQSILRTMNTILNRKHQEELDDQYKRIRENPRDLFDDGVLNNTTNVPTSTSVPSTDLDGSPK